MSKIKKILVLALLSMFSISGVLLQTIEFYGSVNFLIIVSSAILAIFFIFSPKTKNRVTLSYIDFIYVLFIVSSIISILINGNLNLFLSIVKLLVFYIILVIFPKNNSKLFKPNLYIHSFSIASLIGIVLTISSVPISIGLSNYSGIFENPNSLGMFVSVSTFIFVFIMFKFIQDNRAFLAILFGVLSLFSLYLVSISASRTALIGLVVSSITIATLISIKKLVSGKISTKVMFLSVLSPIIILLIFFLFLNSPLYIAFQENFIAKSISRGDNVTAGRTMIWKFIIRNTPFFGNDNASVKNLIGFSAHNSFLSILDNYGWIPTIIYILFWIQSLFKSIRAFMKDTSNMSYNAFAVTSITLFISMSMTEVLTNTLAVYVALSGVAILQIGDKNSLKSISNG